MFVADEGTANEKLLLTGGTNLQGVLDAVVEFDPATEAFR